MEKFPEYAKFCHPWRSYQSNVLNELDIHLDDKHLNIVASPGSGKTILGLEVMLRLNRPSLVLAPSIAIRNQWITRFTENFLNTRDLPLWISKDIRFPEFLTVSTYQGLHAAFTGKEEDETDPEEDNNEDENEIYTAFPNSSLILNKIKEKNIQTIVIDEAHHLRNAWWKSLTHLKENIENAHVVALTATPPYDVSFQEWKNYQSLCGPIDAEISVPELVHEKNLCPHQDYVYLNYLSPEESSHIKEFRERINSFLDSLKSNQEFIDSLMEHPCLIDPESKIESILEKPEYYSAISIFLNYCGKRPSRKFLRTLSGSSRFLPGFTYEWGEILLENFLFTDRFVSENKKDLISELKRDLKKTGAIEKKKVYLHSNSRIKKLFKESLNKLNSILDIVKIEYENLGDKLRMVILTDYIRNEFFPGKNDDGKDLTKIGVVPIFEKIRREFPSVKKIGILSGSLVVIPESALSSLFHFCEKMNIPHSAVISKKLFHDNNYFEVKIKGADSHKTVGLITELFTKGTIEILIGTKSLLGEGWDAPSINTLILASVVGSFMLSNQMRGRAIRIDKKNPDKVSNIWHLASVETNNDSAGDDYETLKRRFKAFVGISVSKDLIENGFERMSIQNPPFSETSIAQTNSRTLSLCKMRDNVRKKWIDSLAKGAVKKIVPELKTQRKGLPRNFVFYNTIFALFWRSLLGGFYFFLDGLRIFLRVHKRNDQIDTFLFLKLLVGVSLLVSSPGLLKSLYLFLRNGPVAGNMREIGTAVLETLSHMGIIKTGKNDLRVVSEKNNFGEIFCGLEGGTSYEKSVFLDCIEEIVSPITNPRYILTRQNPWNFWLREDYHSVPAVIANYKSSALYFARMWSKHVGSKKLVYTRNIEGRKLILRARQKALSAGFQKPSERVDRWK